MAIHKNYVILYNDEGHANLLFDYELSSANFVAATVADDGRIYLEDEAGDIHAIVKNKAIENGSPVIYVTHLRKNASLECFQVIPELQFE